jgi:hypothetical protein
MVDKGLCAALAILVVAFDVPLAFAAPGGVTEAGIAQVEVVSPLVVSREDDLAFGAVLAGDVGGAVTVTTTGDVSFEGGARQACLPSACASAHPGRFLVVGEPGRSYRIHVPASLMASGSASDGSGSVVAPLLVDDLRAVAVSRPQAEGVGQLDDRGEDHFGIGGVLHLPAGLPSADYRATVPVMVTYS